MQTGEAEEGGTPRIPAMHHDGTGEGQVDRLHLLEELEHANGGEGHPEVGPAGEVKLRNQSGGLGAITGLKRVKRDT